MAKRYQSNTGKRRCILLLILLIVGLIIVLIYKPRRHSAHSEPEGGGVPPPGPESSEILDASSSYGLSSTTHNGWNRPHMYPKPTTAAPNDWFR